MAAINGPGEWTYGIQLPIQSLSRSFVQSWEDDATVDDLVRIATTCDGAGYGFVGVCDHVAVPDNEYAAHMSTTWYDTVATLGFLAGHTERTRLLSVVWVAPYRHPLATAKAFGTLDHLSGGRAILGVGAGHVEAEFDALGIDFRTRGRRLDETLDAIRGVYSDTYVSHSGDFYEYDDVGVAPQPATELPIWVGGMGAAAWRRTGRIGDGWIPMGNALDQYPEAIETMRTAAEAAGRGDVPLDIGFMTGAPDLAEESARAGLAENLRAARAAGANTFHLMFRGRDLDDYVAQLERFAEQVVPLVEEG